jgi:polyisoprenoid-binding protein YceI
MKRRLSRNWSLVALALAMPALLAAQAGQPKPMASVLAGARFVPAPSGNEVRYRVREQLANLTLPNDAVGATSSITGAIAFDKDGNLAPGGSKFVIDIRTLESDASMRDRYIQRRTLETETYPTVELMPTALRGLPSTLPASGDVTFELVADLAAHGVTRPTTWQVKGAFKDGGFTGTASTVIKFADFNLTKPRVARVLSVEDDIRLEYDFHLVPSGS